MATAGEIDDRLHAERVVPNRTERMFSSRLGELPNGEDVVVLTPRSTGRAIYIEVDDPGQIEVVG